MTKLIQECSENIESRFQGYLASAYKMIISHKHRYIFVQLPRTACSAIANELKEFYDGQKILNKHANYKKFLRIATKEEKEYFVFSSMRNPMDRVVSHFLKMQTDHKSQHSTNAQKDKLSFRNRYWLNRYLYIQKNNLDFADYFLKFYKTPYDDWSCLSHHKFNFIIYFERLQEDFEAALKLIGIKPVRPIPLTNKTKGKKHFLSYYDSPEVIMRAKKVFGPYMKKWGYEFPPEWGDNDVSLFSKLQLQIINIMRKPAWRYL